MNKNQLFVITAEAFYAASQEEIKATVSALKEVNLYALPFPSVDVRIAGDCVSRYNLTEAEALSSEHKRLIAKGWLIKTKAGTYKSNIGASHWVDFKNICLEHHNYEKLLVVDKTNQWVQPQCINITHEYGDHDACYKPIEHERNAVADILICLLATRNAVKTVTHRKAAKFGIGGKKDPVKRYEYITTISVPKELEADEEHKPTGVERAPHLRRGHIRRQHHGPKNVLVKTVWIAPVFVNADKEWVSQRKAYNVSL